MRLISWNTNGIRAAIKKGFFDFFHEVDADIFAIQESKMQKGDYEFDLEGYHIYQNDAEKKGYSGGIIFTKHEPLSVSYGIGIDEHDTEGRVITLEYDDFYFIGVYTPNSGSELKRLGYRMTWEDAFREYIQGLMKKKGVIICGDLNVAHKEIDLKNPKGNVKNAGFTIEERTKFQELLDIGLIDTFRYFYPDMENIYSWWSYRFKSREKNIGWRIDYFLVSEDLKEYLLDAEILTNIHGSDHCPVMLELKEF